MRFRLIGSLLTGAAGAAAVLLRRRGSRDAASAPPSAAGAAATPEPVTGTPPPETPGPSVTPPAEPASETERAERADATVPQPDPAAPDSDDTLVAEQEAAAASEAAAIGGRVPDEAGGDPSMEPVYQAGGGEAEGFEGAERDLIANASHDDPRGGDPQRDALRPEAEEDHAVHGEADHVEASEVVDPEESGR